MELWYFPLWFLWCFRIVFLTDEICKDLVPYQCSSTWEGKKQDVEERSLEKLSFKELKLDI